MNKTTGLAGLPASVEPVVSQRGADAVISASQEWPINDAARAADVQRNGTAALHSLLEKEFASRAAEPVSKPKVAAGVAKLRLVSQPWSSRLIKSAIGLALLVGVGIMPALRLFQVSSVEAVVNARLVTIRSPIDGVMSPDLRTGGTVASGMVLASVANPRVDTTRLNTALGTLEDTNADHQTKTVVMRKLVEQRTAVSRQLDTFRQSRIRAAEAKIAEADARISSARATEVQAVADLERKSRLRKLGKTTKAALEIAERDAAVANAAVDEAIAARSAIQVEFDVLQAGFFFGDDYNDAPRSAQRLDEIDLQMTAVQADIAGLEAAVERAGVAVQRERRALDLASKAELLSPVEGRIWQALTSPGEQVVVGQELFSVLDCSRLIVSAVVSEATYNTLRVGMPAQFTLQEGGAALPGTIVQLSGIAEASSNYAISPSALLGEAYRVSVAVDNAPQGASCGIGQTGRVVFQPSGA